MTSDITPSGVACTLGVTPRQLVQSSSENDTGGASGTCRKNGGFHGVLAINEKFDDQETYAYSDKRDQQSPGADSPSHDSEQSFQHPA